MSEATQEIIINTVMFAVALLMICWIFYIIRHGKAESKLDELLGTEWQVIQWADLKHNDRVRVYFTKGPIEFDAKWDNEHINPTYEMFLVKPGDNLYGGKNYFPINEVSCTGLMIERLTPLKSEDHFNPLNHEQSK